MAAVVHASAALPLEKPKDIWEVTVQGAENVYSAALKYGVKKSVHIGTTAVYGIPRVHPLYEDSLCWCRWGPMARPSARLEQVCRRPAPPGPGCDHQSRPKSFIGTGRLGVFQILFDWVQSGKKIPVLGTGENLYQLLEVTDLVQAVWLAAHAKIKGDDYNVGATKFSTVNNDVGALCKHAGQRGSGSGPCRPGPPKWPWRTMEAFNLSPLYKWVYETCDQDSFVDTTKLQKQLKWKPKYSNAQMLCSTYDWYLKDGIAMAQRSGTTHRVAWKQGLLGVIKKFM